LQSQGDVTDRAVLDTLHQVLQIKRGGKVRSGVANFVDGYTDK
jgi:hypothetical protein